MQEAFLDLMLPVVLATIRHFELQQEQTSGLHPRVRKALRRRERLKARPRAEGESDAVFKVVLNQMLVHGHRESHNMTAYAGRTETHYAAHLCMFVAGVHHS